MNKKARAIYSRFIKYSASRRYFGSLKFRELYDAHHDFRHTQDHDKPVTTESIYVGNIDGTVICKALLREMSYNPKRFGKKSPFFYNGYENIYYFCRNELPTDTPGYAVLCKVREFLIKFMNANHLPNGAWGDKIKTNHGYLTLQFVSKKEDANYTKLTLLRDALRQITEQNRLDFNDPEYRHEMISAVTARWAANNKKPEPKLQTLCEMTAEEKEEDRLDKAEENAQITADTAQYRYAAQIEQAQKDLSEIKRMRMTQHIH